MSHVRIVCILYRRVYKYAWCLVKISLLSGALISPCKIKQECTIPSPSPPLHATGFGAVSFAAGGRQRCSCCPCTHGAVYAQAANVDGSRRERCCEQNKAPLPCVAVAAFRKQTGRVSSPEERCYALRDVWHLLFLGSVRAPGSESRCCCGPAWSWGLRRAAARGTGPSEHGLMRSIRIAAFKFHRF